MRRHSPPRDDIARARRHASCLIAAGLAALCWAAPCRAQGKTAAPGPARSEAMRPRQVVSQKYGVTIPRPQGWVVAPAEKGTVASFHAAGAPNNRIEVRASSNLDAARARVFFSSFHSSLLKAGFVKISDRKNVTYGALTGEELEYQASSGAQKLRLIVWQYQRKDTAWLVVGFFSAARRDAYYAAFQSVIKGMKFH